MMTVIKIIDVTLRTPNSLHAHTQFTDTAHTQLNTKNSTIIGDVLLGMLAREPVQTKLLKLLLIINIKSVRNMQTIHILNCAHQLIKQYSSNMDINSLFHNNGHQLIFKMLSRYGIFSKILFKSYIFFKMIFKSDILV